MIRIPTVFLVLMALFISACDSGGGLSEIDAESLSQVQTTKSLPVAFDRVAGYVAFDVTTNEPSFVQIQTTHPVLHFAGMNLDGSAIAYTSLRVKRHFVLVKRPFLC